MYHSKIKLKEPVICDYCGRSFHCKSVLRKHISVHTAQQFLPRVKGLTCELCNLVFTNKGLLMIHNVKLHENKERAPTKIIQNKFRHICQACQINFFYLKDLKHHIREFHFNLLAHLPYCQFKKVNQVWFEKVLNSTNIVEIKKVGQNTLLMKKLDDNTAMKVSDHFTEVIDLHDTYPTQRKNNAQCKFCFKMYDKWYLNKHIKDVHMKYKDSEFSRE